MAQPGEQQLSDAETKTLFLHGLFSRSESHSRLFSRVGLSEPPKGYKQRSAAAASLREKGLLDKDDRMTPAGWSSLSELVTPSILDSSIRFWENALKSAREERDRYAGLWGQLGDYLPSLHPEPERRVPTIHAPEAVKRLCEDYLAHARLCLMVGAWAGAVQYCSLTIEHTLAEILRIRQPEMPYDKINTLSKLIQKVAGMVKGMDSAARKLADQIAIFRNGSVHPRAIDQRPGESEARAVYDMTLRFLNDVRQDWFDAPSPLLAH